MEKTNFEECMKKLEECAEKLKNGNATLEESIEAYVEGKKYYMQCSEILNEAKGKIRMYGRKG